jgi:hypothetical protein
MRRVVLIWLFFIATTSEVFGQTDFLFKADKTLPATKRWKDLQSQYNFVPTDKLQVIEKELDSIVASKSCYKFIHNDDTTKFIAFFLAQKNNPSYSRLTHFGQVVHRYNKPSENNSIQFYGYILWGMKYANQWYYHKHLETEFWDKDVNLAQTDFLFYILNESGFLKTSTNKFWSSGGDFTQFKALPKNNPYLKEYVGLPEIVGWHKVSQGGRQRQLLNEKIEIRACALQENLWIHLHISDSSTFHSRYKSKYSGKSCLILYNADGNKILLPILFYDSQFTPWVTYYFATINSEDTALYKWTRFPARKISRKPGDEALEIIYDIRNFIDNWSWGTVNMISRENFWRENFTEKDLENFTK